MPSLPGHGKISFLVGEPHHHEDLGRMLLLYLHDKFFSQTWQLRLGMTGGDR